MKLPPCLLLIKRGGHIHTMSGGGGGGGDETSPTANYERGDGGGDGVWGNTINKRDSRVASLA